MTSPKKKQSKVCSSNNLCFSPTPKPSGATERTKYVKNARIIHAENIYEGQTLRRKDCSTSTSVHVEPLKTGLFVLTLRANNESSHGAGDEIGAVLVVSCSPSTRYFS